MQLKIERLIKRDKVTKFGNSVQYSIASGNEWYDCWEGQWNRGWKEGDTVEVHGITEREGTGKWAGRVFKSIQAPPKDDYQPSTTSSSSPGATLMDAASLESQHIQIMQGIRKLQESVDRLHLTIHGPAKEPDALPPLDEAPPLTDADEKIPF